MKSTRLRGHALLGEGHALSQSAWHGINGPDVARCTCGATSAVLHSTYARQKWHRDVHKPEVRDTVRLEQLGADHG
jgi:hypothetical protein